MVGIRIDINHALRTFRRRPGWSFAAVATLGLGIGGATAIYAVVHAVLLAPLPYPASDRLVSLAQVDAVTGEGPGAVTFPWYEAWRGAQPVFPSLGAYAAQTVTLNQPEGSERVAAAVMGAAVLRALRTVPVRGRGFAPEDDGPGGDVALLSYESWRARFGSREDVVGSTVVVNERARTIIGVMPPGFAFPAAGTELWLPLSAAYRGASTAYLSLVARLPDGLSLEAARAGLAASPRVETEPGEESQTFRLTATPLRDVVLGDAGPVLGIFAAAVGVLLLVATLNVANLLLVRAAERERELTVRAALGAGRRRLARLHLVEGLMLAAAAGLVGGLAAIWVVDGIAALGADVLPRAHELRVDPRVALFAAGLAALVGTATGVAPALRAPPADPAAGLRAGAAGAGGGAVRGRGALVVAQVALATALLGAGGLLGRSFLELWTTESGFDEDRVATIGMLLPSSRYGELPQKRAFYGELLARLEAAPEFEAAAGASFLPFTPARSIYDLAVEGRATPEDAPAEVVFVTPRYFDVMGVRLRSGRLLRPSDDQGAAPAVVISESLARRHWPADGAVGSRIRLEDEVWRAVVGVVADTRQHGLDTSPSAQVYVPYGQAGEKWPFGLAVIATTARGPASAATAARAIIASIDADVAVSRIAPLSELRSRSVAGPRLRTILVGVFSALALLLAVIGVYGVMAYATARRTREVGIRIALGASGARIVRLVVRQAAALVAAGIALGLPGALYAGRLLEGWLFGVGGADAVTLAAITALTGVAALAAAWLPARRASRLEPVRALRAE